MQEQGAAFSFVLLEPEEAAVQGEHVDASRCDGPPLAVDFHLVASRKFAPVGNRFRREGCATPSDGLGTVVQGFLILLGRGFVLAGLPSESSWEEAG